MEISRISCEIEGMSVEESDWNNQIIFFLTISKHQLFFGFLKYNEYIFKNK